MPARRNFLIFAGVVAAVLVLSVLLRGLLAQRTLIDGENVIFQSNYRLSGLHDDNLVVSGDVVALDETSRVTQNASFIADKVTVSGIIDGDLNVLGDNLTIEAGAEIGGDLNATGSHVIFGGTVKGDFLVTADSVILLPSATISGSIDLCSDTIDDQRVDATAPECINDGFNPFAALIALRETSLGSTTLGARIDSLLTAVIGVVSTILLTGLSALVVTLFPRQISHIEEAVRARPRKLVGVGIATYALTIGITLAVILALAALPPLGLLLIPFFLILTIFLLLLSLGGLITLALILGDWLARRVSKAHTPPLIAAMIGSLLLSVALGGIAFLPFGYVISFAALGLISSVGLGGALATRVGTRSVRRAYFIQG